MLVLLALVGCANNASRLLVYDDEVVLDLSEWAQECGALDESAQPLTGRWEGDWSGAAKEDIYVSFLDVYAFDRTDTDAAGLGGFDCGSRCAATYPADTGFSATVAWTATCQPGDVLDFPVSYDLVVGVWAEQSPGQPDEGYAVEVVVTLDAG